MNLGHMQQRHGGLTQNMSDRSTTMAGGVMADTSTHLIIHSHLVNLLIERASVYISVKYFF